MRFKLMAVVSILTTFFLVVCGGGGQSAGGGESGAASAGAESVTFNVEQGDIYYGDKPDNPENPPKWEAPAGATMKVNLKNNGALDHNWAVVEKGAEIPEPFIYEESKDILIAETGLSPAGKTVSYDLTAPKEAGEYTVICTVAGHYPSMQGRLVVTE